MTPLELITIALAIWGALTGTVALGLDISRRMNEGARIQVDVGRGTMVTMDIETLRNVTLPAVWVAVSNNGDRPTTITNVISVKYDGWLKYLLHRERPTRACYVVKGCPHLLGPGARWIAEIAEADVIQDEAIVRLGVHHSASRRPLLKRLPS